jgi:hypothetical protein
MPNPGCAWSTCAADSLQRYADAAVQLETATRLQPNEPGPFLSLGALHLELRQPQLGEAALLRYLELLQAAAPAVAKPALPADHPAEDDDDAARQVLNRDGCRPG